MKNSALHVAVAALAWTALAQDLESDLAPEHKGLCDSVKCTQEAMSFAWKYGYPLFSMGDAVRSFPQNETRPNKLLHHTTSNPDTVNVVRPNADTLYSTTLLDLSSHDLELTVPDMPTDRYWVFPFYTPYGDDLVNLGILSNSQPGKYLIKFEDGKYGLDTDNPPKPYTGVVTFPMVYGISDMRIYTNRSDSDVEYVRELQRSFALKKIEREGPALAPPLNLSIYYDPAYEPGSGQDFQQAVMKVVGQLAHALPPYMKDDRVWVKDKLVEAGVNRGTWTQPEGTNLTAAVAAANASVLAFILEPGNRIPVGNNWTIGDEDVTGVYYSEYTARYMTASAGYLALWPDEAVYPSLSGNSIDVADGEALLFTFPEPPHIKDTGFWSLTAYGPDQGLIENDRRVYSLGKDSNLTYPDGQPLSDDVKEPFQILLQSSEVEPPSNWISNWLPITPGAVTISTTLRWYGAAKYMSDGSYVHPEVEHIDLIQRA